MRREGGLTACRVVNALSAAALAVGFTWHRRVLAVAGYLAALCGNARVWPAVVVRLRPARRSGLWAVVRSTFRVAPKAYPALGVQT